MRKERAERGANRRSQTRQRCGQQLIAQKVRDKSGRNSSWELIGQIIHGMISPSGTKQSLRPDLIDTLFRQVESNKQITVYRLTRRELGRFIDLINKIRAKIGKGYERKEIDATDIQILACSIADRNCIGLLTFDARLINSPQVKDIVLSHARDRRNFIVTEDPRHTSS